MKLPKEVREGLPISLLPGGSNTITNVAVQQGLQVLSKALPNTCPKLFTAEIQEYVLRNTWVDMGDPDSVNSVRALQNPISGLIAGRPGLTHEIRSIIALALCARWGTDIDPGAQPLYDKLQKLIGPSMSFWCEYIGTVARLLATVAPGYGTGKQSFVGKISFVSSEIPAKTGVSDVQGSMNGAAATGLGKKGNREGVSLKISVDHKFSVGLETDALTDLFKKVGDSTGYRVEAKLL
jgi:retrograde regulation protein 2